jgi:hypothetical protein
MVEIENIPVIGDDILVDGIVLATLVPAGKKVSHTLRDDFLEFLRTATEEPEELVCPAASSGFCHAE